MKHRYGILNAAGLFLLAWLSASSHAHSQIADDDNRDSISTNTGYIQVRVYKNDSLSAAPVLAMVIHGDSPLNNPGYQYRMARQIAEQNRNTVAIGVLRPGYTDPDKYRSGGVRGLTTGDNYTPEVINAIAEVIKSSRRKYNPSKILLIGHSGGAVIAADLAGMYPDLIDAAILVACPCNVPEWRGYMQKRNPDFSAWSDEVTSISPDKVMAGISSEVRMVILSGSNDDVAPTELSKRYYQKLVNLKKEAELIVIPEAGHDILFDKVVIATVHSLIYK